MEIQENIPLASLTTFKIGGKARYFCRVSEPKQLEEAYVFAKKNILKVYIIGGGSNVLISDKGLDGLVIMMDILGIEVEVMGSGKSRIISGAGESWDYIVSVAVEKGLSGLENLSGIPGTAGGAPVQNIGAYGVEVKDSIAWVEVFDPDTNEFKEISNKGCKFDYRDSVFKKPESEKLIITRIAFDLKEGSDPKVGYKDLADFFAKRKNPPTVSEVRNAVLEIRSRKFAEAIKHGTAGSFFKNPIVSDTKFKELKKVYPDLPGFNAGKGKMKVSLGWIIDKVCGLKGFRLGKVGISPDQALVVINYGGANCADIKALSDMVLSEVSKKTGIEIEPEVRFVG